MLGNLLAGFIVILVGVTLLPPVANAVTAAQGGNITGVASTIIGLTTIFYALGIASAGISMAANGLRQAGMI